MKNSAVTLSAVLACVYLLSAVEAQPASSSLVDKIQSTKDSAMSMLRGAFDKKSAPRSVKTSFIRKESKMAGLAKTHAAVQGGSHVFRENSVALSISSHADQAHAQSMGTANLNGKTMAKQTPFSVKRHDLEVVARARAQDKHEVVFAIKQRNADALESLLHEISDPKSPKYGKHLTREQVVAMTRDDAAVAAVKTFLATHYPTANIVKETRGGEYLTVQASVSDLETLFATDFYQFEYKTKVKTHSVLRAASYALPRALDAHVDHVFNTVQFPVTNGVRARRDKKKTTTKVSPAPPLDNVTPALLNDVYSIYNSVGNSLTSQALYESIDQSMSPSDLTIFQQQFNLTVQPISSAVGGHVYDNACDTTYYGGDNCGEANLDVQYIMGVAQSVPTVYYYWAGEDFMLDWITTVANSPEIQDVYSISYGADEGYFSLSYAYSFNSEAIKLGLMGSTIVVAAGDDGALSPSARYGLQYCGYNPSFPATSPYVVAVGATMGPETNINNAEVLCSSPNGALITGGGGFSTLYLRPYWQDTAVSDYVDTLADAGVASGYSKFGRAYPDVSLLGHSYYVILGGEKAAVDGTSASAPVFAGMVSLINSERAKIGLSKLGWITSTLYYYSDQFSMDILTGFNNCTAVNGYDSTNNKYTYNCCAQGFPAAQGWDAVSGLGSVNFNNLLNFATNGSVIVYSDDFSFDWDDDTYTGGIIAGIVIGSLVGFCVIGALCYYVFFKMNKGPLVAQGVGV